MEAGRYGEALALVDEAETLDPLGDAARYERIRAIIRDTAAAGQTAGGSPADDGEPALPEPDAAPETREGQGSALPAARAGPGTAPATPPLADAASAPGGAVGGQ